MRIFISFFRWKFKTKVTQIYSFCLFDKIYFFLDKTNNCEYISCKVFTNISQVSNIFFAVLEASNTSIFLKLSAKMFQILRSGNEELSVPWYTKFPAGIVNHEICLMLHRCSFFFFSNSSVIIDGDRPFLVLYISAARSWRFLL